MRGYYRHTKIIATLGPATESPERIRRLILDGVDVFRINMAHATHAWAAQAIQRIREASRETERHAAVMLDLNGPEIRTGVLEKELDLELGQLFEIHTDAPSPDVPGIDVNYPGLPADVEVGGTVLVDAGLIRLEILEKTATSVRCRVTKPGRLGSQRHVHLPGVHVRIPSPTAKDKDDMALGVANGVDFFALSFTRHKADVDAVREYLIELGSKARIIAKVEDQIGLRNLESIAESADAIMAARGDLSVEIEFHILPLVQARIIEVCQRRAKPVIVATQLLESMITSATPTRADISDVSNAIAVQVDAVMLSGETAIGSFPRECVTVLKNVMETVEPAEKKRLNESMQLTQPKTKMLRSAAVLAQDLGNSGIVVFTRSGTLPYTLGGLRPQAVPIYAFTDDEALFRQLLLPWGVEPFYMPFSDDPEETIRNALAYLKRRDWCDIGTWLVVITNALAHGEIIDTIQVRQVP